MAMQYSALVDIRAPAAEVFAYIDDIRHVAAHMSARRSPAMIGSRLTVQVMTREVTGVGAIYRYVGRLLGLAIEFKEQVVRYSPPTLKEWATIGQPRMLILEGYVMTFTVTPMTERRSRLAIALSYTLPTTAPWRWLGRLLAPLYARWCVEAILRGTREQLEVGRHPRTSASSRRHR